jgi:predicted anti-sigma-YlaC factor YlaD
MRCAKARKLISDELDGLLTPNKKEALQLHLESCPGCREFRQDLAAIVEKAMSLPSLEPSPSSWNDISASVGQSEREERASFGKQKSWQAVLQPVGLRYALAAALTLLVISGGIIVGLRWRQGTTGFGIGSVDFTLAKLREAQDYYEKAVSALSEAVRSQREGMDPRLAEAFQQNLESIDATIQACQQIVRNDPDNITARNYLLAAYRDKVSFLEEVMGLKTTYAGSETGVTL